MTEHIREEYALRSPTGEVTTVLLPIYGQEALDLCRENRVLYAPRSEIVHRTVTFTDWEEV